MQRSYGRDVCFCPRNRRFSGQTDERWLSRERSWRERETTTGSIGMQGCKRLSSASLVCATVNNRVMTGYRDIIDDDGSKRGKRKTDAARERVGEAEEGSKRRTKLKQHRHRRWALARRRPSWRSLTEIGAGFSDDLVADDDGSSTSRWSQQKISSEAIARKHQSVCLSVLHHVTSTRIGLSRLDRFLRAASSKEFAYSRIDRRVAGKGIKVGIFFWKTTKKQVMK